VVVIVGEYLELSSPTCATEVMGALADVLGVPASAWQAGGGLLWRLEHQQVEIILDGGSDGPGTARLALADPGGSGAAGRLAGQICRHLAATTPWTVEWTADTMTSRPDVTQVLDASLRWIRAPERNAVPTAR
jgi:hypothetical protein